jgi:hypothetical protein
MPIIDLSANIKNIEQLELPPANKHSVIDTIEQLLKQRTDNDQKDRDNISKACELIQQTVKTKQLPKHITSFETLVTCCYCHQPAKAKFYISTCRDYLTKNKSNCLKTFRVLCNTRECVDTNWNANCRTWLSYTGRVKHQQKPLDEGKKLDLIQASKGDVLTEFLLKHQQKPVKEVKAFDFIKASKVDALTEARLKVLYPNAEIEPDKIPLGNHSCHYSANCYRHTIDILKQAVDQRQMLIANVANITDKSIIELLLKLPGVCLIISDVHRTYPRNPYTATIKNLFAQLQPININLIHNPEVPFIETSLPHLLLPRVVFVDCGNGPNINSQGIDHNKQGVFLENTSANSNIQSQRRDMLSQLQNSNSIRKYVPSKYLLGTLNWTDVGALNSDAMQIQDSRDEIYRQLPWKIFNILLGKIQTAKILVP